MGEWTKLHSAVVESAALTGYAIGLIDISIKLDYFVPEFKPRAKEALLHLREKSEGIQRLIEEHVESSK